MKLFKVAIMEVHRKTTFVESTSRRNAALSVERAWNRGDFDALDDDAVSVSFRADIEEWDVDVNVPKKKGA